MIQQLEDDRALLKLFYEVSGKDEHGSEKEEDDATLVGQTFTSLTVLLF